MEAYFGMGVILTIIVGIFIFFYFVPIGLWITSYFSGVKVSIVRDLIGMRLRKVPPGPIVKAAITANPMNVIWDSYKNR
jgi:uncharacterized protein YqfA (UPF0365 family)